MRFILLIALLLSTLEAQPREALLIGNHNYSHISDLNNPINNLKRLKRSLEEVDFNVKIETDLNSENLAHAIERFKTRLAKNPNTIGFLYYTGHGCQVDYQGYLIPTNVDTQKRLKIKYNALSINEMLETLKEAGNRTNLLFLDACRDVPTGTKGGTKGLGRPHEKPIGTLLVYATEAGKVANDNDKFINALIQNIKRPNQSVERLGSNISRAVAKKSGFTQIPEVYAKLLPENLVLKGGVVSPPPAPLPEPEVITPLYSTKGITTVDGLMYQNQLITKKEDKNYKNNKKHGRVQDWKGAIQYCQDLTLGGYSDWRLPNKKELKKLVSKTQYTTAHGDKVYMRQEFAKNLQDGTTFWSSTTYEKDSSNAWLVDFNGGID